MPTTFIKLLFILLTTITVSHGKMPIWSYDAGPDRNTEMGRELIDLTANIPAMHEIANQVMGDQKFRPPFGPVPWRMIQTPNKTKILFIGQDATHIAEAAGRPATAGFGGRAQDLARYLGVNEGAAFINTYAFTIKGQYGAFKSPYLYQNSDGDYAVRFDNFVDNQLWAISQDQLSPITQWRNDLIDWIIRNNLGDEQTDPSIKLIVLFGGAARDAIATFIESRGGDVKARYEDQMDRIQIPEMRLKYAGGNNEFPVVVDQKERDLYQKVFGKEFKELYNRRLSYKNEDDQQAVREHLKNNLQQYIDQLVFTKGGPHQNGLLHPAQLGGFDLDQITIEGELTRSLRGLTLNGGVEISHDILVISLPHPSALSRKTPKDASAAVARNLADIKEYVEEGWEITPDDGMVSEFAEGKDYVYGRANIGPEYYDFGTPGTRMVAVSTASRMSGKAHVIVFGTRDRVKFNRDQIDQLTEANSSDEFSEDEMFIARARTLPNRYIFDPGPGENYAALMKSNLDLKKIFKTKPGKTWKKNGIDAYNVKNHPDVGDFGHYRGTFKKPSVLILADPQGYDDLITARALTGTRGQYLQGLMEDIDVPEKYLVIKTVPFGMDQATPQEWEEVLKQTQNYRQELLDQIFSENSFYMVITDGPNAEKEMNKYLAGDNSIPVVNLKRVENDLSFGIVQAQKQIRKISGFEQISLNGEMKNIPRSHLSFYSRLWEGTSGDRVLSAEDNHKGQAFAEVAPKWAWSQEVELSNKSQNAVNNLVEKLEENKLPTAAETLLEFIQRLGLDTSLSAIEYQNYQIVA